MRRGDERPPGAEETAAEALTEFLTVVDQTAQDIPDAELEARLFLLRATQQPAGSTKSAFVDFCRVNRTDLATYLRGYLRGRGPVQRAMVGVLSEMRALWHAFPTDEAARAEMLSLARRTAGQYRLAPVDTSRDPERPDRGRHFRTLGADGGRVSTE